MPKKVLFVALGSYGDVHPMIGVALEMQRRGHEVIFGTNGYFIPLAEKCGLRCREMGTAELYLNALKSIDLFHPRKALPFIVKMIGELTRIVYDCVAEIKPDICVAATLAFGARIACEKFGIPLASVVFAPSIIPSYVDPPKLEGLKPWYPRWLTWLAYRIGDRFIVDPRLNAPVNGLRRELGMPPVSRMMTEYWLSPDLVLCLFPDWFVGPALPRDWPAQVRCTGFPLFDEKGVTELPAEIEAFLKEGPPPIVFTPGSAMVHGQRFFAESAAVCATLGMRGMFLTRYGEQIPKHLPAGVKYFPFAPLSQVLPRSAAFVCHGGVGSVAQGLASGRPQLVTFMAHDQMDNAARVVKLGAGSAVRYGRYSAESGAVAIRRMMEDPGFVERAGECRRRLLAENAVSRAAEEVERIGG